MIIVAPQAELAAREKADLAAKKDVQELSPLRTEYLQVNYAKAADMAALIKGRTRTRFCPRAATSRSMSAPTPCCCRTRPTGWATSAAWSRPWTSRCARCSSRPASSIVNNDFERDLGARFGFTDCHQKGGNGS